MATRSVLPSVLSNGVGTPEGLVPAHEGVTFAAQYPARTFPYRRFAPALAGSDARLGVNVVGYSFIVWDFHLSPCRL